MNKKLKYALIGVLVVTVIGVLIWLKVNKPVNDFSDVSPKAVYSFKDIMDKTTGDTSSTNKLIGELVEVIGTIKTITRDSASTTVELGDTASLSSIICQIDKRHQDDFNTFKEGQEVVIKGKISGFNIDTELGLGNTIQMNYCSLHKNK